MSENQTSELDPTELIGLVEGTVSELKDYIRGNDFSDAQLEQILSAESSSKDRKTAKKFLKKRIGGKDIEQNTSNQDKNDNEEENENRTEKVDAKKSSLSREALLQMLGGTVEDVKAYVKENNPDDNELQTLLHAEKIVKDRKTVVKFLKSYSKKKELEEDFHKAETDLKELKEDLENIEESVLEEDVELELDNIPEPRDNEDSSEEETEEAEDEELEQEDKDTKNPEESDEEENEKTNSEENKDEDSDDESEQEDEKNDPEEPEEDEQDSDDEEDELTEMEKKKQILENLEMDLSEEELEQISLEELKKLKEEKEKREQLIDSLSMKFDREQLEKVTTKDLEKLADEVGKPEDISKQEAQRQEEAAKRQKEKDEAEMKKEAQHDLEMMMGAVKNEKEDDEEDSEPGAVDQLKQLPDKFKGILSRGKDEEEDQSTGFDRSKTIEVLESYSEAEDHEAAVKTAQVMKGYLEYALEIEREMTYAELAEEMESREVDSESINTLIEFYRSMKIAVYTGDVETDNIDEVIEASEAVVKELG